jgi:predicted permease
VVVLSLALGIGANTAIFSVINAVMLRMLPVPDPQQLVMPLWHSKGFPQGFATGIEGGGEGAKEEDIRGNFAFSSQMYQQFKSRTRVFSSVVAFAANEVNVNIGLNGTAEAGKVHGVSGDFFEGLQVSPQLGRLIVPSDDADNLPVVAVISNNFWHTRMGADPRAVGQTIAINGAPVTIIGVSQPGFYGVRPGEVPDLWMPLSWYRADWKKQLDDDESLDDPGVWWLGVVGRLKPGLSGNDAEREISFLYQSSLQPVKGEKVGARPWVNVVSASRGIERLRNQFSKSLLLLMSMVALVLLIACANLAGLLLARGSARSREIALRLSLGAAPGRIIRQLLTESVLLGLMGGATGLLLARWLISFLVILLGSGRQGVELNVSLDWIVLVFTAAVSILSGVMFGLAPAWRATRVDLIPNLKQSVSTADKRRRFLSGKALVVGQVALCLVLLVCSGLLIRTWQRLQTVRLGFDRNNLVTFTVHPGLNGYKDDRLVNYYEEMRRRIGNLPRVESVTFSQMGPVGSGYSSSEGIVPGFTPPGRTFEYYRHRVAEDYFKTLRIPIKLGRTIGPQDTKNAPLVVVVNEKLVRDNMKGANPIGLTFDLNRRPPQKAVIIGVADDVRYDDLRESPPPTAYFFYQQVPLVTYMTFQVRTIGDPIAILGSIRQVANSIDPNVPMVKVKTEAQVIEEAVFLERTFATLSSGFGLLALILACLGLYGIVSFTVAQRTGEIGIRMALGAKRESILRMVLLETGYIVCVGLLLGLPLVWIGARLLASRLFELSPHDPNTIALSCVALVTITLLAGVIPARRASRVDPMVALRHE